MQPAIMMKNIKKVYPDGVIALRGVSLEVMPGEIHGLLGENGAGKTTLMRILYGEIKPSSGEIWVFGRKVSFRGPWDAIKAGIGMVYQKFALVQSFTVMDNIMLSVSSINRKATYSDVANSAKRLMKKTGLEVPLDAVVEDLPVGIQQRVEILKTLLRNAKVLILDEPTSVLTPVEAEELFKTLKSLREMGIVVIFITHKLKEVMEVTDRITVLRKGRVVGTVKTSETTPAELAKMMVGREVFLKIERPPAIAGNTVLKVKDVWVKDDRGLDAVRGVTLEVREGEILGIAGVQGNGQTELAEAVAGLRPVAKGKIYVGDIDVTDKPTSFRYRIGLAYVPDSRSVGLVMDMNITENVILTNLLSVLSRYRKIRWGYAREVAHRVVKGFDVITPSLSAPIKYLSGGNQQKVMVGREIVREPKAFVVAEPTHGLDVGATEFIRKTLASLKTKGKAIMLISTDLDEILQLSDRIAVMYEGKVMAVGPASEFTLERLGLLMGGVSGE